MLALAMNASLGVGILLLAVKVWAAAATGSSGIFSDAAESAVHLLAVGFASICLRVAARPADATHHFGHGKIQFFSAGFEGAMICLAALFIFHEAGRQLWFGPELRQIGFGIVLTAAVALVNLVLGLTLLAVARRHHSVILQANGQHVLTDVYTSIGVLAGLALVYLTGLPWWDPLAAILVAANILRTGWRLVRRAIGGLMDETDPGIEAEVRELLGRETHVRGLGFHQVRHRFSGDHHWIEFHLVFPDGTCLEKAHEDATAIEGRIAALLKPAARVISHLEPQSAARRNEPWEGGAAETPPTAHQP